MKWHSVTSAVQVLMLLAASQVIIGIAQSQETFAATGNMTTPRRGQTATLLTNGKVLIAGGMNFVSDSLPPVPSYVLSSAELYDPLTGTFTPTGSMTSPRTGHTATLLSNGKVLIASGSPGPGPLFTQTPTAELYDPDTGTFTPTGAMVNPGSKLSMLLPDGKVLIFGAHAGELYDPDTGSFAEIDPYSGSGIVGVFSCTPLADGRVLLIGDAGLDSYKMRTAVFDPRDGGVHSVAPLPDRWRSSYSTTLMTDGTILLAGGDDDWSYLSTAETYDPAKDAFAGTGDLTVYRDFSTATLLSDGKVLISGGQIYAGAASRSAELYDPVARTFAATGDMLVTRFFHTATLLLDGRILVAGGDLGIQVQGLNLVYVPSATYSAEIYTPSVKIPAPVLLSLSGDGQGPGAILHAGTQQLVSSSDPAVPGEALEIYCMGLQADSVIPPQVAIGGRAAEVLYFGGQGQINVRVPAGVPSSDVVPVRLTYLGRPSNEVTLAIR